MITRGFLTSLRRRYESEKDETTTRVGAPAIEFRCQGVQSHDSLGAMDSWTGLVSLGLGANSATFNVGVTNQMEFYRIRAYRPLGP